MGSPFGPPPTSGSDFGTGLGVALGGAALLLGGQALIGGAASVGAKFLFNSIGGGPNDMDEIQKIKESPSLKDVEGTPVNWYAGPRNRVEGTIIWVGNLRHKMKSNTIGGGFFDGGQTVKEFDYFIDLVIAAGEGPVESITRIWADGTLIYHKPSFGDIIITGDDISVETGLSVPIDISLPLIGNPQVGIMRLHSAAEDLTVFNLGAFVSTSGFSNAENNLPNIIWFFPFVVGSGFDGNGTFLDILNPFAVAAPAGNIITITQIAGDLLPIFNKWVDFVDVRLGELDAEFDTLFDNLVGPFQLIPNYRGTVYAIIRGLHLRDFSNRIPPLTLEVKRAETESVGETIERLLQRAKLTSEQYEVHDDLFGINIRGIVVPGPTPIAEALRPILRAYNVLVQENSDGKLKFFKRGSEKIWVVPAADLAAHEQGSGEAPRPIEITDTSDHNLPSEVNVNYLDARIGLQKATQRERRINVINENAMEIDLPITLFPGEARQIAARELWAAAINRQKARLSLGPKYVKLREGDLITTTANGIDYRILITNLERGNNFRMNIEGIIESPESLDLDFMSTIEEDGVDNSQDDLPGIAILISSIIDVGLFSNSNEGIPGVYVGVSRLFPNVNWQGADLYAALGIPSENDDYGFLSHFENESNIGVTTDNNDNPVIPTGLPGIWDYDTKFEIKIPNEIDIIFADRTFEQVLQGANWARLGNEIIAFQKAASLGDGRYIISRFLRGLRNTEGSEVTHSSVESFTPINPNEIGFIPLPNNVIGQDMTFASISPGGDLSAAPAKLLQPFRGKTVIPFQISTLRGERTVGTDDIIITYERRTTHHRYQMFGPIIPPQVPGGEAYLIEIYNSSGTVLRASINRQQRFFMYNETDQTADGFTPGDTVLFRVFQQSSFGLGPYTEISVT